MTPQRKLRVLVILAIVLFATPSATATRVSTSATNVSQTPSIRTSSPTMAGTASGSWISYFEWADPGDGLGQHRAAFVDGAGSVQTYKIHGLAGSVSQEYKDSVMVGEDFYVLWYQMFASRRVEVRLAEGNQSRTFLSEVIASFDMGHYPSKPHLAASDHQIAAVYGGNDAQVWTRDLVTGEEEIYDLQLEHPGWQEGWDVAVDGHDIYVVGKGLDGFVRLIKMDGSTGTMTDLPVSGGAVPSALPRMQVEAAEGILYVAYAVGGDAAPGIVLAESTDGGQTYAKTPIGFRCSDDHAGWISCGTDFRLAMSGGNPFLAYTDRITFREGVEQWRIFAYQCLASSCSETAVADGQGLQEITASDREVFISFYQWRWEPDPAHPEQFGGRRIVDDLFVASKPLVAPAFDIENVSDSSDPDAWDPRWGTDLTSSSAGYRASWPENWREEDGDLIESDLYAASGGGVDGNLAILDSEAVQSVLGISRLVRNKPTAIKVRLRNGMGREVSTNLELITEDGATTTTETYPVTVAQGNRRVFLNPDPRIVPQSAEFRYELRLDPTAAISETDEGDNTDSNTYPVKDTKPFSALFVSMKSPGHAAGPTDAEMKTITESAEAYIKAAWPLDPEEVNFDWIPNSFIVDISETVESADELVTRAWEPLGNLNPSKSWDAVVGVTHDFQWMLEEGEPLSSVAGLSLWSPGETGVTLVKAGAYGGSTVAHEMSHDFRWVTAGHPLTDTISDPGGAAHIDLASAETEGYWVDRGQYLRRFDYMYWTSSLSGITDPSAEWPSAVTYDFLLDRFAYQPQDPPLVAIRGQISASGSITAGHWYSTDGFLDAELGDTGYYTIRYLNDLGALIDETGFGDAPTDDPHGPNHGSIASQDAPLSVNVPDLPAARKIQILHDGVVLYERTRSANAPSIEVTTPNGGETLRVGDTMTVTWDSSDADGDTLHSLVSISTDGGATWLPIGNDVQGNSLDFELTRSLISSDVLVKVMATDGLNTDEDVSDAPFEIILAPAQAERIVFASSSGPGDALYTIEPDGSNKTQITATPTVADSGWQDPDWSPDGQQIVAVEGGEVWLLEEGVGGIWEGVLQLTTPTIGDYDPAWSPDGTKIAFSRNVGSPTFDQIGIINSDGTGETILAGRGQNPTWSPDGSQIAFERAADIYIVNADGTGLSQLTADVQWGNSVHNPAWSPDGNWIAAVWEQWPSSGQYAEIALIKTTVSRPASIYDATGFSYRDQKKLWLDAPEWGPDGRTVAFVEHRGGTCCGQIMTFNAGQVMDKINTTGYDYGDLGTDIPNACCGIYWGSSWLEGRQAAPVPPPDFPIADAGGPYTTNEGEAVGLDASASSGEGSLDIDWDFDGDGDYSDATGTQSNFTPPDDGVFEVAVRVTDQTGQFATQTAEVQAGNVDPAIGELLLTEDADGGGYISAVVDDVAADILTAQIDWGDGSDVEVVGLVQSSDGRRFSAWHAFFGAGPHTVQLNVADDDGGTDTDSRQTTSVPANSVPMVATVSASTLVDTAVDLQLDATDPDGPLPMSYEIVDQPLHGGLVSGLIDGGEDVVRYMPEAAFVGEDSFTYRVFDGHDFSRTATVTIDVTVPNVTPEPTPSSSDGGGGGPAPSPSPSFSPSPGISPTPSPTPTPTPTPTPPLNRCTLFGTPRADVLTGTPDADVICGRAGADRIVGLSGDDVLRGGRGADLLIGGRGFDRLFGNRGGDKLRGGAGDDDLKGGRGADLLIGRRGFDRLFGNRGGDKLRGGAGDDDLKGGRGVDVLSGGPGRDVCIDEPGDPPRRC